MWIAVLGVLVVTAVFAVVVYFLNRIGAEEEVEEAEVIGKSSPPPAFDWDSMLLAEAGRVPCDGGYRVRVLCKDGASASLGVDPGTWENTPDGSRVLVRCAKGRLFGDRFIAGLA